MSAILARFRDLWNRGLVSFRVKLIAGVSALIIFVTLGFLVLVSDAQQSSLETEITLEIARLAESLEQFLSPVLLEGDELRMIELMEAHNKVGDIRVVALVDTTGELCYSTRRRFFDGFLETEVFRHYLESAARTEFALSDSIDSAPVTGYFSTIYAGTDTNIGALLIGFDRSRIYQEVDALKRRVLLFGIIALLTGGLLTTFLADRFVAPIERLKTAAMRIGAGEFGKTVEIETRDEIGALAGTFNTMSIELKKREEEVRRAERLSAIGQTASVVAHEMKTPLTSVKTYVEMLSMKYEDPAFRGKFAGTVEAQVTRLEKLVDDLLDYSRDTRLHLTELDLSLHLHQAVAFFGDMFVAHRTTVREAYHAERPVAADPDKLEQIFFNLIRNAVEAQAEEGALALLTFDEGDDVIALVADAGTGITEETMARIFEPFVSTKAKGTGLGLAIARKITEAHQGTIAVHSPFRTLASEYQAMVREVLGNHWPGPGAGTCFLIGLPALTESDD